MRDMTREGIEGPETWGPASSRLARASSRLSSQSFDVRRPDMEERSVPGQDSVCSVLIFIVDWGLGFCGLPNLRHFCITNRLSFFASCQGFV